MNRDIALSASQRMLHPLAMPASRSRPPGRPAPRARVGRLPALTLGRSSWLACAAFAAISAHAHVAQGPVVQAVTSSQAGIWVRTSTDQSVRVRYHRQDGVNAITPAVAASLEAADDTASFVLPNLLPGTTYGYEIGLTDQGGGPETWTGTYTFQTVPDAVSVVRIAVLADFKDGMAPSPALQTAIDRRPDFLAVLGDLDHRDPASGPHHTVYPPEDAPQVLEDMRSMHRDARDPKTPLGANFFSGVVGAPDTGVPQIPMAYAWDDHDFCANNMGKSCPFAAQAFRAYNDYNILAPDNAYAAGCKTPGDFQSLTFGKLLQVFILDARSARNDVNANGSTAMLGACQHNWLVDGLRKSKATWKIVMSPVPMNPTMKTWDSWGLFATERNALLNAIASVRNVVFVSGDVHSGGAIDEGEHSGRPEVSTPHADMPKNWVNTFCREENKTLVSRPGSWTIGSAIDPNIGVRPMNCLAHEYADDFATDGLYAPVYPLDGHDNPGFTWIEATKTSLTVNVHGIDGKVKEGVRADGSSSLLELKLSPL